MDDNPRSKWCVRGLRLRLSQRDARRSVPSHAGAAIFPVPLAATLRRLRGAGAEYSPCDVQRRAGKRAFRLLRPVSVAVEIGQWPFFLREAPALGGSVQTRPRAMGDSFRFPPRRAYGPLRPVSCRESSGTVRRSRCGRESPLRSTPDDSETIGRVSCRRSRQTAAATWVPSPREPDL